MGWCCRKSFYAKTPNYWRLWVPQSLSSIVTLQQSLILYQRDNILYESNILSAVVSKIWWLYHGEKWQKVSCKIEQLRWQLGYGPKRHTAHIWIIVGSKTTHICTVQSHDVTRLICPAPACQDCAVIAKLTLKTRQAPILHFKDQLVLRKGTYVKRIKAAHPNYLRKLYQKAGKNPVITFWAFFTELADEMNRLSCLEVDRPQLFLSQATLKSWFHCSRGKVRKGWEWPICRTEWRHACVEWCNAGKEELKAAKEAGNNKYHQWYYYCLLDEKWFSLMQEEVKGSSWRTAWSRGCRGDSNGGRAVRGMRPRWWCLELLLIQLKNTYTFDGKVYFTRVAHNCKLQKTTYGSVLSVICRYMV